MTKVINKKLGLSNKNGKEKIRKQRSDFINKELKRIGKVGGIYDNRLSARDNLKTNDQKLLQRHIVEKLRQLSEVPLDELDEVDPLVKAAFANDKKFKSSDEIDGGIGSNIVDEEFFTTGSELKSRNDFKDALSEKIAVTRLERLKRVEENEQQREKLKTVDTEWNKNIRFLLSNIPKLKSKEISSDGKKNVANVSRLLEELSADQRIAPVGFAINRKENFEEIQLNRLDDLLKSGKHEFSVNEESLDSIKPQKTAGYLLRILLKISSQEFITVTFLANQLAKARYRSVKDVIHNLMIVQLLIEQCEIRFNRKLEEKLVTANSFGNLAFCPEVVHALVQMLTLACPLDEHEKNNAKKVLILKKSLKNIKSSDYSTLDITLADPSVKLSATQLPLVRLACIHRLLQLTWQTCHFFDQFVPKCVLVQLTKKLNTVVRSIDLSCLPSPVEQQLHQLLAWLESIAKAPTPDRLIASTRLTVLSNQDADNSADSRPKLLKQFGLIDQLEPSFDERLDARRPKKKDVTRVLQRKIAKEKRGVMRDIRRDSRYLAEHDVKRIKENDAIREKKTKLLLNSLRSVED